MEANVSNGNVWWKRFGLFILVIALCPSLLKEHLDVLLIIGGIIILIYAIKTFIKMIIKFVVFILAIIFLYYMMKG